MSCYRQYSGAFYLLHFGRGGGKAIKAEDYADLLTRAARTGLVDLVDVGAFMEEEAVRKIICAEILSIQYLENLLTISVSV